MYLADPVIVELAVSVVPGSPIIGLDLNTMFVVIVVIWFSIIPVLIFKLEPILGRRKSDQFKNQVRI